MRRVPILVALCAAFFCCTTGAAEPKHDFSVAWSMYIGWLPWDYAARSGILKKWADKYGISIKLVEATDYGGSIADFTAGRYDGCAMTNVDVLTGPAASGVDSTVLIVGSFSDGNDAIVLKGTDKTFADLRGQSIDLVTFSVSHYLLSRGLEIAGLGESDVRLLNTSEADIVARFSKPEVVAAATWKPYVDQLLAQRNVSVVLDSSRIPGEIMDLMVINTAVLRANPNLGRALAGAWYESLGVLFARDERGIAALTAMGKPSNTGLGDLRKQLATTKVLVTPMQARGFMAGSSVTRTMDLTRNFSYRHDLLGSAKTVDSVGIQFPAGRMLGDPKNVKVRFDVSYVQMAAEKKF